MGWVTMSSDTLHPTSSVGLACRSILTLKPQETGLSGPSPPAHLKTDRAIMVGVKGIEEKSGICAGVCGISVAK